MNLLQIINTIVVMIGLPSIIAACIYIGRKLQSLDSLQEDMKQVKGDISDIKRDLSGKDESSIIFRMKHNIRILADHLTQSDPAFNVEYLKTMSPFQLSDEGEKLLADSGFKTIVSENEDDFVKFIGIDQPATKYDVQQTAYKAVFMLFGEDYFVPIKTFLYNNPTVTKNAFLSAAAVYVRDVYLAKHPEIKE